jgi:predicted Zn-dependent peptidase
MNSQYHERKFGPTISEVSKVNIPKVSQVILNNEIPLFKVNLGTQDVIKFEWVFKAGRPFETKNLAARATASQLKEGTSSNSSFELAEKFDFLGATLQCSSNFDTSSIVVYCLRKHFLKIIPLVLDIWENSIFPAQELEKFKLINQQNLKVELSKNDVIAYRELTSNIFGETHPYGYNSVPESYQALQREDLISHFNRCYGTNNSFIIISGKVDNEVTSEINKTFGRLSKLVDITKPSFPGHDNSPHAITIKNQGQYQVALRFGRKMFTRNHPDFIPVFVLNTILGGYFGSRLMKSIREEKGYTYNIYSALDFLWLDGYFYIHTEVGNDYLEDTRQQIFNEISNLQENLVPEKELKMVRNYLMGNVLGMLDGPFNVSKVVKSMAVDGHNFSDFQKMIHGIATVNANDLRKIAQKYFKRKDLWEIIVTS